MSDKLIFINILILYFVIIIDKIQLIKILKEVERTKIFNAIIFTYLKDKKDFIEFNKEHNIDILEGEEND